MAAPPAVHIAARVIASSAATSPPIWRRLLGFHLHHHRRGLSASSSFAHVAVAQGRDAVGDDASGTATTPPSSPPPPPSPSLPLTTVDVCIVGGGVVGTALACALKTAPLTSHLSVMLADRAPPPSSAWLDALPAQPEARVSALTPASVAMLREVGAWDRVVAGRACPFTAMQVWDAKSAGHVRYEASEVGETELGHVVENRVVHTALFEAAVRLGVICAPPASLASLHLGDSPGHLASLILERTQRAAAVDDPSTTAGQGRVDDGSTAAPRCEVKARLVVGADGARSNVRQLAGEEGEGNLASVARARHRVPRSFVPLIPLFLSVIHVIRIPFYIFNLFFRVVREM